MNCVLFHSLHILPEVAVMNRCSVQVRFSSLLFASMKIVQIRPPAPTCCGMIINQLCSFWLTLPPFDLVKWPHWFWLIPFGCQVEKSTCFFRGWAVKLWLEGLIWAFDNFLHGLFKLLSYHGFKAVKSESCLYFLTFWLQKPWLSCATCYRIAHCPRWGHFLSQKHMWEVTWEVMQYRAGGEEFLFLNGFP